LGKDHEHVAHPNFARGQESTEHEDHHDEPRPDFARGTRSSGDVTTESERGSFAEGHHEHDGRDGDFAKGARREPEPEEAIHPDS
jgi:hypothetical protein